MEKTDKTPETLEEQKTLAVETAAQVETKPPTKKKKAALYVVLAIGAVLILSGAYDRFFSAKGGAKATVVKEDPEKVVALLPPPPQPVEATTTAAPAGTPSKKQISKEAVAEWVNTLRKAIMAPALSSNAKLDDVAEAWLTAKLMNMGPEKAISQAMAHNGNHPIHVLHSGVMDNMDSALTDKLAPVSGVKELVSSTLYDGMGIYVHPLTVDKCHVVVVMQAKTALPANYGSAAAPTAAVPSAALPGGKEAVKAVAPVPGKELAQKSKQSKYPVPMPPPAFGGKVIDVEPPTKSSQIKEEYEPYPDLRKKVPVRE